MACGCSVQVLCWICLLFVSFIFFAFVLTVWETVMSESGFCTRTQLMIGAECAHKARRLEDSLLEINQTVRFLRPPTEYRDVVELCEKTNNCLSRITCEDGHDFVEEVEDGFPACDFYTFYADEMSDCANVLLTRTSNYTCLDILFNAKHNAEFDRCAQWRDIQPCVHDAIATECDGNATTLAIRFGEASRDLLRAMNCEPLYPNTDSEDFQVARLVI